jgi:hypothetical protein
VGVKQLKKTLYPNLIVKILKLTNNTDYLYYIVKIVKLTNNTDFIFNPIVAHGSLNTEQLYSSVNIAITQMG